MKTREGFVSNSSTTSFTCQVCGQVEPYSDSCSLEDAGGSECVNGHVFCSDHKLKKNAPVPEGIIPEGDEDYEDDPGFDEEDEETQETSDEDDGDDWNNGSKVPARRCPICTGKEMNLDLVEPFLLKKLGWTQKQIWVEMKKLGKYPAMVKYIADEND